MHASFSAIGAEAMKDPFWTVLIRGIFAGWLIALMVWLLPFAETGRVLVIILITYIVGLGHFSHVIAGAVAFWPSGDGISIFSGARSIRFIGRRFVPMNAPFARAMRS